MKHATLTDRAYDRLEEAIVTLRLSPGAVLSESALATDLGFGRTPIREALQRLAREGLVVVLPRKGILVTEINPRNQILLLEVRRELERLIARTGALRRTEEERLRFLEIADGMEKASRENDDIAFMRYDQALNQLEAEASHNEYAQRAMNQTHGLSGASGTCTTRTRRTCRSAPGCTPSSRAASPKATRTPLPGPPTG